MIFSSGFQGFQRREFTNVFFCLWGGVGGGARFYVLHQSFLPYRKEGGGKESKPAAPEQPVAIQPAIQEAPSEAIQEVHRKF